MRRSGSLRRKLCGNQQVSQNFLRIIAETFMNLHDIELPQLWGQRRVDGVGRLKFDFPQAGGCPSASDAGLLAPAHVLVKSHALGEVHVGAAALSYSKDVGHDGPTEARL